MYVEKITPDERTDTTTPNEEPKALKIFQNKTLLAKSMDMDEFMSSLENFDTYKPISKTYTLGAVLEK